MLRDRVFRRVTPSVPPNTADLALENARELCAVSGPWAIASEYAATSESSLEEIAEAFAHTAYNGDHSVQAAAKTGALQGFETWFAGNPQDRHD